MKTYKKFLMLFLMTLVLATSLAGWASAPVSAAAPAPVQEDGDDIFVIRIYYKNVEDLEKVAGYDLFEYNNLEKKYVLAAVTQAQMDEIDDLGFKVKVDDEETANFKLLSEGIAAAEPGPEGEISILSIPGYTCYRTVEETYTTAQNLAINNPTLASWIDVGDSWDKVTAGGPAGYDMMVLKLTNSNITGDKPKMFVNAAIHAREYATAELATRWAEYLVSNYNINPDVTWLLDYHEIHIMLHTNPDGRKKAEAGASWRKNTDSDDGCSTTYGVDLNRGFTYQWGGAGTSSNPCDSTYRGPSAGSEPEDQAVMDYMRFLFPDQRGTGTAAAPADTTGIHVDLHSYGQEVLYPWDYTSTAAPNRDQLRTLARKLAFFNSYDPIQGASLYLHAGTTKDFLYGELGVASYCFETGTAFFQACSSFESTVNPANQAALTYAAKVARTPYMTPLGPDAISLALSAATVPMGTPVTLTATINDTRYRSGTGEPVQNIAAAEYYIDTPPWVSGAAANAMAASDGSFSATSEGVTASIATASLTAGRHTLFVRGRDVSNNWGAITAIFLNVETPTGTTLISFTGTEGETSVTLEWETGVEIDNLGFNVYRSESEGGEKIQLNAELIDSIVPPGSLYGAVYGFEDTLDLVNGTTYFYWLEDINTNQIATMHGPVEVQFGEIVEPFVLVSFTATGARRAVNLAWITSSELTNTGFNLYRATSSTGTKTKVNSSLIASKGPAGGSYTYSNTGLVSYRTYYYWLQTVDTAGATQLYGPVYAKTK